MLSVGSKADSSESEEPQIAKDLVIQALSRRSGDNVVFHDLDNPCPTTSLTLSHVKKQGYRGGSVGGSFSCGRSGAIRDFKGMGGQTHGHINN